MARLSADVNNNGKNQLVNAIFYVLRKTTTDFVICRLNNGSFEMKIFTATNEQAQIIAAPTNLVQFSSIAHRTHVAYTTHNVLPNSANLSMVFLR